MGMWRWRQHSTGRDLPQRRAHERHHRGRVSLKDYAGFAACGGFSYGDVLGAGEGWASSILFNGRARDDFEAFFARGDTFAFGVCNGCQMMSNLRRSFPGRNIGRNLRGTNRNSSKRALSWWRCRKADRCFLTAWRAAGCPLPLHMVKVALNSPMRKLSQSSRPWLRCVTSITGANITEVYPLNPNGSPFGYRWRYHTGRALQHPYAPSGARVSNSPALLAS